MIKLDKKLKVGVFRCNRYGRTEIYYFVRQTIHGLKLQHWLQAHVQQERLMKKLLVTDGKWQFQCLKQLRKMIVHNVNEVEAVASTVDFVFSAVDMTKEEIKKIEEDYAKTETPVVSNNSAHRWTPDVPMVVPEINPEHYEVIESSEEETWYKERFCCC